MSAQLSHTGVGIGFAASASASANASAASATAKAQNLRPGITLSAPQATQLNKRMPTN
jgi:hypothetical protein